MDLRAETGKTVQQSLLKSMQCTLITQRGLVFVCFVFNKSGVPL